MYACRFQRGAHLHGSIGCCALLRRDDRHDTATVVALRVLQADEGVDGVAEVGYVRDAPQQPNLHTQVSRLKDASQGPYSCVMQAVARELQ